MRRCLFAALGSLLYLLLTSGALLAEEKNGMQMTVSRKTLDRNDQRNTFYSYDRIDRTQGLKISLKNVSFKEFPEGELEWTILVRKYSSSGVESYTGKENIVAIKPAVTIENTIGAAAIRGWNDLSNRYKDKLEYQVIVRHEGKETIRVQSTPSFDTLKKRAVKMDR